MSNEHICPQCHGPVFWPPGTVFKTYCSRSCKLKAKRQRERGNSVQKVALPQGVAADIAFPTVFQLEQATLLVRQQQEKVLLLRGILPQEWQKPEDIGLLPQPDGALLFCYDPPFDFTPKDAAQ